MNKLHTFGARIDAGDSFQPYQHGRVRIVAFVHKPADLLRLNNDDLQCRECGRAFPAVAAQPEAQTLPSSQ